MADTINDGVEELKAANAQELHRAVREEGQAELQRPASSLFWSGLAAGLTITASLLAEGALEVHLPDTPARPLITAIGYPMGFLLVILGRMQLFTESTITAMLPLVTAPSRWAMFSTLRLWAIVIAANLVGTSLSAAGIVWAWPGDPAIREGMITVSHTVVALGPMATFLNAIPAGFLIAILAWALPNAREQSFFVIFAVTYLVAIGGFSHSIVGSNEAFVLIFSGEAGAGRVLLGFLIPAILGNLVGGAGLFAVLAHAQVKDEMHGVADPRKRNAARRNARPQPVARKPLSRAGGH